MRHESCVHRSDQRFFMKSSNLCPPRAWVGRGGGGGGGEWVVDELLNCPCRDRAADKLGHRAVTSSYPGKFKRLLSGILFLMLLTIKIRKLVLK